MFSGHQLNDEGNAERLAKVHGANLRYIVGRGWIAWTGKHWEHRDSVYQLYRDVLERMRADATDKSEAAWARQSGMLNKANAAIAWAASMPNLRIKPHLLDTREHLLTVDNGEINLITGELQRHQRHHLSTSCLATPYDPDAKCPIWDMVLDRVTCGDQELAHFLRRAMGYSITGSNIEQTLFIALGTGHNGKTTFLEAMRDLLEDYASTVDPNVFTGQRSAIPSDIARLQVSRMVATSEPDDKRPFDASLIKQMTGGERLSVRFLRKEWFEFQPKFTAWCTANQLPYIPRDDPAVWRRLIIIPFSAKIPKDRPRIREELEAESKGMLAWAVRGAMEWYANGLRPPDRLNRRGRQARREQGSPALWILSRPNEPDAQARFSELRNLYRAWCSDAGAEPASDTALGIALTRHGLQRIRDAKGPIYKGIK